MAGPAATFERVRSWGMVQEALCMVRHPRSADEVRAAIDEARTAGLSIGQRGGGNSYGDAALINGGLLIDFSRMNRILSWDAETGILRAEPGVTIADVWQHIIEDGYWLPVVPGTMLVTLGGAAAMNIHGKNNFRLGTFGQHVESFRLVLADGREIDCSPLENAEVYYGAIGGFGVLGCFTELTLRMKRVHSGLLEVEPLTVRSFDDTIETFESLEASADYLVGWHDGFLGGARVGAGLLHRARHLAAGDDPDPRSTLAVARQSLPSTICGLVPRTFVWPVLWCFLNDPGMRLVNWMKRCSGRSHAARGAYRQAHAAYHFLLDYVPRWKLAYRPGGLIQFQSFVPGGHAAPTFARLVRAAQRHGHPPYLCVTKRHVVDPFLMTHAVDGYSLALDFKVTRRGRKALWTLARGLEEIVLDAGGRFYFAKDSVMTPATFARAYPAEVRQKFFDLKARLDPEGVFSSDLFRRICDSSSVPANRRREAAPSHS